MALLGGSVVVGEQGDAGQSADRLGGGQAVRAGHLFPYRQRLSIQLFSPRIVAQREVSARDPVHIVTQLDAGGRIGLCGNIEGALGERRSLLHVSAFVLQIRQGRQ